jgi:hypothetical protein
LASLSYSKIHRALGNSFLGELFDDVLYRQYIDIVENLYTEEFLHILNTGIDALHPRRSNVFLEEGKEDFKKLTAEITNPCLPRKEFTTQSQ